MPNVGTEVHLPLQLCPVCGVELDCVNNVTGQGELPTHVPKPHDATVCIRCNTVLEWDDKMQLVRLDLATVEDDEALRLLKTVRWGVSEIDRKYGRSTGTPRPWERQ